MEPPPQDEFDKVSMVSSQSIRKHFSSWAKAIERAGFEYRGKNYEELDLGKERYSEECMISGLQRVQS
jgi:hypothetical protein